MPVPERLGHYIQTEKQRHFSRDFLVGWENYETWEDATVGESAPASHTFTVEAEDVAAYNRACGETDRLYVDPEYARENSPTGELLQHPIFVTAVGFYCVGASGIGSWMRTPGARNPGQRIEIVEPFRTGEVITTTVTTREKFIQRGKHYLTMFLEFRNERGNLKGTWDCSLILPPDKAAIDAFVSA
jgi:acyl dehydratase